MRVLILTTQLFDLGGAERLQVQLAADLSDCRGIHAELAWMYDTGLPIERLAVTAMAKIGLMNCHSLGLTPHPEPFEFLRSSFHLRRLIKERQYDIVETALMSPTIMAGFAIKGLRTKHVVGIHAAFQHGMPSKLSLSKKYLFRASIGPDTGLYTISEYAAKAWCGFWGKRFPRPRVIYNSIAKDFFSSSYDRWSIRGELGIPTTSKIILFAGRLMREKGIDTLLEAMGPILDSADAFLIFVGNRPPGQNELFNWMNTRILENGWADRVIFLGKRDDIARIMSAADVFAFPSRWEGFGLVLAEAMASGLPIVATNVDAIPEILEGTKSVLVPPDDPYALRKGIIDSLERPLSERIQYAETNKQRAVFFRHERRTTEMIDLFASCLTGTS